ncbi:MAG: ATP-binding protein [Cyanobacteria bacterium J06607_10]
MQPTSAISQWFNNLQLQNKIGWSLALSIGVACVGITTGLGVANASLTRAQVAIEESETEREMLNELKVRLLRMHLHQKGAILTLNDLSQWTGVYELFLKDKETFEAAWIDYEASQGDMTDSILTDPQEQQLITELATSYAIFSEDLNRLIDKFEAANLVELSESERQVLQDELTRFNNQALRQDAYRFLDQVKELNDISKSETETAQAELERAEVLRLRVIIISVLTSLGFTTVLIILLSRAISSSVEKAAETAKEVIETSNFDLQIPVTSTDEIGRLSAVLNRLIVQVRQLLKQEQEKSDSLEKALDEVKSAQAALVQNEKMSALGQMVAGIAHEINNPVNFIHGNLAPLQSYTEDFARALALYQKHSPSLPQSVLKELEELELEYLTQDSEKILESMWEGTQRIREIVLSLRNFSRLDETDIKSVDIHEGLDSTLTILAHRLKNTDQQLAIEVEKNYADLPQVECYASLLNQVFMNLLSNAIDALEEKTAHHSQLPVDSSPVDSSSNQISIRTEVADGENAINIRIKDNGAGISEEAMDKLFNPFFTTKEVGKGTGLGLSISHKIITEKHKGVLQCSSEVGQGTEFVVQLPIRQDQTPLNKAA